MFEIFNMGIGFCYVVDPNDADLTLSILEATAERRNASDMESLTRQHVRIHERKLLGHHKTFKTEGQSVRKVG